MGRYDCRPDSYLESTTQKLKLPKLAEGVYVARLLNAKAAVGNLPTGQAGVKFIVAGN
jgi:hypothetical protein